MIKKIALSIIILLIAAPVFAQEPKPKDTLFIAIRSDFQPFTFLNAEGRPAGIYVDIWRLWAQKTGKQIEFISSNLKTSLENLKNQKADIHSGLLYSPDRSEWISFSEPFYDVGISLFYSLKQGKISSIKELSGQTVAVLRGSQMEQFLKKYYPDIRIFPCNTIEELVNGFQEGKAKAFILTLPVGTAVINRMGLSGEVETFDKILYREKFHAGVLKKNTELLALVDKGFNAISRQELVDIEARWIPDPAKRYYKTSNIIQLTPAEEIWLRNHKTIRLGIAPVMPPLKFFEKGVIKGLEPDYINLLSEYTGINFQLVVCDFKDMDTKAKSGEMDMFLSVYVPERFAHMMFTKPFMDFDQVIVTRSDAPFVSGLGSLKGKKVAVLRGLKLHEKILAPYPEIETVGVDTMEQMFKAVSESKADAMISKMYLATYVMNQYPNLKIAGIADIPRDPYYYAVRKDYPELVGILNKAIESIPNDRVNAIVQKWFSVRVEYRPNWSEILKWAFVIGGAFTLILCLSLFWNRRLAREIAERRRTEEALQATGKMAKIGGWEFDVKTMEQVWTEETYRIHEVDFDYKPTAEKGIDFYAPEAKPVMRQAVQRAIDHGEPFDVELPFITAKGTHLWVHAIGKAIQKDGKTIKVSGTFQDITDRKQAEEALRESEEQYRTLVHNASDVVFRTDENGYFTFINPVAIRIT
jgi:ABC-type amino acid transport substrate-binding protein